MADKGVRPAARALFVERLPQRVNTRAGNTEFRKGIIAKLMDDFVITLPSGSTAYNDAFINARTLALTNPVLAGQLVGLGRPEDKKGGRKPKAKVEAPATAPVNGPPPAWPFPSTASQAAAETPPVAPAVEAAPVVEEPAVVVPGATPQEELDALIAADKEAEALGLVSVFQGDKLVKEDIPLEEAEEMVAAAKKAKKTKLTIV